MTKKLEFTSVFESNTNATGPRLPTGKEFEISTPQKEEPPFSPLKLFSQQIPQAANPLFTRNIANRLWFIMMGRGIVHPLDLHHSDNQPSHPKVLQLVAEEFAKHHFDIKWLLKELALSNTYQRSSIIPDGMNPPPLSSYQVALEKRLSAEQLLHSTLVATGEWNRINQLGLDKKSDKSGPTYQELMPIFLKAFSNSPREPEDSFQAAVKGALFLLNDDTYLKLIQPRLGNLQDRLASQPNNEIVINELFLSIFSRDPNPMEIEELNSLLQNSRLERNKLIQQIIWGMLSSMEFYVNH